MTQYFPIIVEQESNGSFSAWVAGLPGVYAAADTVAAAKRGIRGALAAHLDELHSLGREPQLKADVTVPRRLSVRPLRRRSALSREHPDPRNGVVGHYPRRQLDGRVEEMTPTTWSWS